MRVQQKTIVIVAFSGVQLLDVSGPLDVFAEANAQAGYEAYQLLIAAPRAGPIRSSSGARLMPNLVMEGVMDRPIDTLLVAGCPNAPQMPASEGVTDWLRRQAPLARRFGSVCSGAFFLAAA